jgi:hypothetical protein
MIKVWFGAAVAVAIFLFHSAMCGQPAADLQHCSVVRCT